MHMARVHKSVPDKLLSRDLFDFVVNGPKSEGNRFYDANRTELCMFYLNYLTNMSNNKDIDIIFSSFISPLEWKEFEQILLLPIHRSKDLRLSSEIKTKYNLQVMKISQLLQMSSRSLAFLSKNIRNELYEIVLTKNTTFDVTTMTFTRVILKKNIRDVLKLTVRLAVKCWIEHGHWVIGHVGEGRRICKNSYEQYCATESMSCLDSFGSILCYVVWLYCYNEDLNFGDKSCCFIIQNTLSIELETYNKDLDEIERKSEDDKKKHNEKFVLNFILSLESEFSFPLQKNLAKLFEISREFAIAVDC